MNTRALPFLTGLLLSSAASAQTYTETFEGAANAGGWTFGNGNETIEATGGNPGEFLHNWNIDVIAPEPHTTTYPNPFTGDWRARGVDGFEIDLITFATNFPFEREATLMLTDGSGCWVYYLGTDYVPQTSEGWKSFRWDVPVDSPTLPAGWFSLGSCPDGNTAWNTVIQDVREVRLFYGNPIDFFIFDTWDVGLDNARIVEQVGTPYCTSSANSTGSPAELTASGSTSVAAGSLRLAAGPVPNEPGIFFFGSNQVDLPFGNGRLCASGGIVRLGVVTAEGERATDHLDPATEGIAPGDTRNFQYWFRDPAAGGANFDTSDAVSVTFTQ